MKLIKAFSPVSPDVSPEEGQNSLEAMLRFAVETEFFTSLEEAKKHSDKVQEFWVILAADWVATHEKL